MNSAQNWSKKQYPCDIAPLMNGYVKVTRLIKLNWSKKKGDLEQAGDNPSLCPPHHLFLLLLSTVRGCKDHL